MAVRLVTYCRFVPLHSVGTEQPFLVDRFGWGQWHDGLSLLQFALNTSVNRLDKHQFFNGRIELYMVDAGQSWSSTSSVFSCSIKVFLLIRAGYVQLEFDKIAVFNNAWLSYTTLQHANACLKLLDQLKTSLKPGPSFLSSTHPLCSLTHSIGTHHCRPSRIGQDICQHTSVQRQIFFWLETKVSRSKKNLFKCIISLRDLVIFQFYFLNCTSFSVRDSGWGGGGA